ncbi:hypothetical protein [Actinoplanes awajinensis]|uniref:Glycosyl hydrolase family 32 N-terminal domain-containing protein n=1 Tax=Actinoplanes awajinensis subsp. mycoplanecinus TaxID=135947 RepID=A0A0X3UPM3_9ACTN|nr:hypothetical protein [Actinoplanes awajinensis]KUL33762.1 hypothetical protein ADL15_17365 [Actinoplanes awajinensis subsp. mycoplanecinus]
MNLTNSALVASPPATGVQRWAGAPTAVLDSDGSVLLAYRKRGDGDTLVLARSRDGVAFHTIAELSAARLGADAVERAALVFTGAVWRLYVSFAPRGGGPWRIGLLEAAAPEHFMPGPLRKIDFGGPLETVKDPIVHRTTRGWSAWICVHPLDVPGADDRMFTTHWTSPDGLTWTSHGVVLAAREGHWDARGARLTCVLPDGSGYYDGRRNRAENWFERCGRFVPDGAGPGLTAVGTEPVADVRYLDILTLPNGDRRAYFEARRPDGAHELRTTLLT